MDRDLTLPPAFIADPEATLTRRVVLQAINFGQSNNAEAILRHVLNWRGHLRRTLGTDPLSSYCHRLTMKSAKLLWPAIGPQLDVSEVEIKKGLKVH
jgi:hypothetical protein